jgi:hypothetical protein
LVKEKPSSSVRKMTINDGRDKMHRIALTLSAFVGLSALGQGAQASLLGDTVEVERPGAGIVGTGVVSASGITFVDTQFIASRDFTITIAPTQITFLEPTNVDFAPDFNGYDVIDFIKPFPFVTVDGATTVAGFNASDISVSGQTLAVNFGGLFFGPGDKAVLDVSVPEPPSLFLAAVGIFGVGLLWHRRRALSTTA